MAGSSARARFLKVQGLKKISSVFQTTIFVGPKPKAIQMDIDDFKEKYPNLPVPSENAFANISQAIMEARKIVGFDRDGRVINPEVAYNLALDMLEGKKISKQEK